MRVLLLQNVNSRYGVLAHMTRDIYTACIRQGVDAALFDAWDEGPDGFYDYVNSWKPDCTFGINVFAHKELPFHRFGVRHICLSVDALHHYPQLTEEDHDPRHLTALFVDAWSRDLMATKKIPTYWFPHAISQELISHIETKKLLPRHKRPYEAVLLGSHIDCDRELTAWKSLFSLDQVSSLCHLVETALEHADISIQHAVLDFIHQNPFVQKVLKEKALSYADFTSSVELYMRGLDRKRLLKAFPTGSVHVFGEGWEQFPECIVHPPISFSSVFDVCTQAKVILQSAPMIRRGYHERLFLGLAAGATVVTSELNVPDIKKVPSILQYTTSSLATLRDRIAVVKEGPPPLEWLQKHHTWDVRVKDFSSLFPGILHICSER